MAETLVIPEPGEQEQEQEEEEDGDVDRSVTFASDEDVDRSVTGVWWTLINTVSFLIYK